MELLRGEGEAKEAKAETTWKDGTRGEWHTRSTSNSMVTGSKEVCRGSQENLVMYRSFSLSFFFESFRLRLFPFFFWFDRLVFFFCFVVFRFFG